MEGLVGFPATFLFLAAAGTILLERVVLVAIENPGGAVTAAGEVLLSIAHGDAE
jgi:hypothetical protein